MIKTVGLWRFKRWKKKTITVVPSGPTLLVGGNNSGKSSVLQALALWSFCRTVLEFEKGVGVFHGEKHQGVGLSIEDFTAVPVPSLKHLWTNLKTTKKSESDGYTLKVAVSWGVRDTDADAELEFGLALANDRLFVKVTRSTVPSGEKIPTVAYLPPFGGLLDKETRLSPAERRRLIGLGQSGAILRNVLLDYHTINTEVRARLKGAKSKISAADLRKLRKLDPWELVVAATRHLFQTDLRVHAFNPEYHTAIRIESARGEFSKGRFKKHKGYAYRDLMVEGSGFLQWLSVFTLAVDPGVDVLLLDEPDAHLHCSLQLDLYNRLVELGKQSGKQLLLATHSTELIRSAPAARIAEVCEGSVEYLSSDAQKVGILAGIGAGYSPRLHNLQRCKRLLLVESSLDERLLKIWAQTLGEEWPDASKLVVWHWPSGHKERKQLFIQLKAEFEGLEAISLRDKDEEPLGTTSDTLVDGAHASSPDGLQCLKWRRREIENYLIWPSAIASASNVAQEEVEEFLGGSHSLIVSDNFKESDACSSALCEVDGKMVICEGEVSIYTKFSVTREQICECMEADDIPKDVRTAIRKILQLVE